MSKFLMIGNMWKCGSEVADECNIRDAIIKQGHEVIDYNKFDLDKVFEDKPKVDVTITFKGDEFTPETIEKLRKLNPGKPIYYIQHDLMENNSSSQEWDQRNPALYDTSAHLIHAQNVDGYFSKETAWRRQYEDAGVNFIYWPEDACPMFYEHKEETMAGELYEHRCKILDLTRDWYPVIFTGTWMDIGIDRPIWMKPIRDALDLTIFSMNPDAWVERGYVAQSGMWDDNYPYLISKAKVNLGLDWRFDVEGYWSDRDAQIMGAGGFVLTRYVLGKEFHYGPDGENVVYYTDQKDCIEKANYYLEHEEEREEIARRGYEYVTKYMDFDYRVRQLLTIMKFHLGAI